MVKKVIPLLLVVFFSVLSVLPLFHRGFPPTHDGEYHVIRFYEFYRVLSSGVFYPRWAPDLNFGYGVPLFNYVYPLPNYVAALFHLLGFSFIDAFKYNLILSTVLGAIFIYFFVKELVDPISGIVASVFFSFNPYRRVDVYIRGSVGEAWSIALIPGLLWALFLLIKTEKTKFVPLAAILFSLLIFSHNILALLFLPFIFSFAVILIIQTKKKTRVIKNTLISFLLGIGSSAIFWLPAIFEKQFVRGLEVYDYVKNFPDLSSLLIPSWGSGFAGQDGGNAMSTQIGIANILVIILNLFLIKKYKQKKLYFIPLFLLTWFFILVWMMLPISVFLWKILPFFNYVQFPWRYLSVIVIVCSVLAGGIITQVKKKLLVGVFLIILSIGTTISYTNFAYYHNRDDAYYTTRSNFIDGTNSPGNAFNTIYISTRLLRTEKKAEFVLGGGSIVQKDILPERQLFQIKADSPSSVLLHTLYFPGWAAFDYGRTIPMYKTDDGLMKIFLVPGDHFITVRFTDTIIRRSAFLVSLLSLILLCIIILYSRKDHYENRH